MHSRKMWRSVVLLLCLSGYCCAGPLGAKRNMPIIQREEEPMIVEPSGSAEVEAGPEEAPALPMMSTLTLPSNATSIRADITDGFSCENRTYGYYADVENECQIFHVCLPVTYADGKENTFRWSFICPEETVFSQDSFTCMRREDMTIDCEDSVSYYELNRNFGMTDDSDANKNNNKPITSEDQQPAMSAQIATDTQQSESQPQELEQAKPAAEPVQAPSAPATMQAEPEKEKEKPVAVKKPNRRKPAPSVHIQNKLPVNLSLLPLRKMPASTKPQAEALATPIAEATQTVEEIKPAPQRYTKRPTASAAIPLKEKFDKVQTVKTESTPNRVDLYKRKRPTSANKKTPIVETDKEAVKPALVEPEPAVKLETTNTAPLPPKAEATPTKTTAEQVDTKVPNKEAAAPSKDAETQASETSEIIVKPEETDKNKVKTTFSVEQTVSVKESTSNNADEKPEPTKPLEEIVKVEETDVTKTPAVEEDLKVEETQTPIEAIEEIPAVISEVEETKPLADELPVPVVIEEAKPVEVVPEQTYETAEVEPHLKTPAIFEPSSEETISPTIEQLEDAKPANAVDTMPATPEMEHQAPAVEQMFGDTHADDHLQSMGGFKPVDPALAAEAEALITDFLNKLKTDNSNAAPIAPLEMAESAPEILISQENSEESEKTETAPAKSDTETESTDTKIPQTDVTALKTTATEEASEDAASAQAPESIPPVTSIMMSSFPAEMYEIPVKVIDAPAEQVSNVEPAIEKTEEKTDEKTETELPKEPQAAPEAQAGYTPLSIDDIVELVKERLDQVPTAEKGLPMELVVEPQTSEVQVADLKTVAADLKSEKSEAPKEDIVMPIYHRVSEVNSNSLKTQPLMVNEPSIVIDNVTEDKPVEPVETAPPAPATIDTETPEAVKSEASEAHETKASRAYRSRSLSKGKMDARKRRFLFRSDAS